MPKADGHCNTALASSWPSLCVSVISLLRVVWQALFEQAVEDKAGQHFPLLWRCYLSYELQRGHADAARRVLLRAIHTCPGAKALWLDGFHFLSKQVKVVSAQCRPANAIACVSEFGCLKLATSSCSASHAFAPDQVQAANCIPEPKSPWSCSTTDSVMLLQDAKQCICGAHSIRCRRTYLAC